MMRRPWIGVVMAAASVGLPMASPAAATPSARPVAEAAAGLPTDQIIVRYVSSEAESGSDLAALSEAAGVTLTRVRQMSGGAVVLRLPARRSQADVEAMAAAIARRPGIAAAQADAMMQPTAVDPLIGLQWHYRFGGTDGWGANAQAAWPLSRGAGAVVAVVDTGRRDHVDLAGQWLDGYDMISNATTANDGDGRDADPTDPGDWVTAGFCGSGASARNSTWHGTHVAGTVAALEGNGIGGAGVAPGAKVLPVRVLGRCGGYVSDIADAIRWAAGVSVPGVPANPTPASVINLSLGGAGACDSTYQQAIDAAVGAGAVVVVSAGNSGGPVEGHRPANCANVVTVAAGARTGELAYYSNFSTSLVELTAPGGEMLSDSADGVLSTLNGGATSPGPDTAYAYYQGTSMAAPHVSGTLALMKAAAPGLNGAQLTSALLASTRAFAPGSSCAVYLDCGAGWLNAAAAVAAVSPTPTVSVVDVAVPERNSGTFKAWVTVQLSHPATTATSLKYRSVPGGTATAGSDYTTRALSTIPIPAGTTQVGAWVTVRGDSAVESDETVLLQFSSPIGLTLADDQAVVTITNDDSAPAGPSLSVNDKAVLEPDTGTVAMNFAVKLSAASTQTVTVVFTTVSGTALAGADFTTKTVTVTFQPGQVLRSVTVPIKGDTVAEANETFTVQLSGAVNATVTDGSGVGTVTNDD